MANVINGYLLYRLMVDKNNKSTNPRRHSLMPISEESKSYAFQRARNSVFEPFCMPVIQHVPIRERLSSTGRDSSSADIYSDFDPSSVNNSNPYLYRRRRMSLLQTLRYQNRLLADSGVECQSDRGSEITTRAYHSNHSSAFSSLEPKNSGRSSSIIKLKNKTFAFFGKLSSKRSQTGVDQFSSNGYTKCYQSNENDQPIYTSIDLDAKKTRHGKSLLTDDSDRESEGRIVIDIGHQNDKNNSNCSKQEETVAIIEQSSENHSGTEVRPLSQHKCSNLVRSLSCPQLGLHLLNSHEICRRAISSRQEFMLADEMYSEENTEDSEIFMPILEKIFVSDKRQSKENINESTPMKSIQSSSCDATDCIFEKEEFKYAVKLHRDCNLLEGQEDSINDELPSKLFPQQQQQRLMKKSQYSKLSNGYIPGKLAYILSKSERDSSMSLISAETRKRNNDEEVEEKGLSMENFLRSEMGKEILDHYPELDSLVSFYSDDNDDDDNLSSLMLDHYMPPKCSISSNGKYDSHRSSSLSSLITDSDTEHASSFVDQQRTSKVGIVTQTDLSLVHISDQLSSYLNGLILDNNIQDASFSTYTYQGMNFLAKHFFEYQSLNNRPHYAVQLHKLPPSQAGANQSASWAPKSMIKAGKNQAAPAARANRSNTELKLGTHRYGRPARHEYREWGDKHGELKGEKLASHKDALTKFLSNEKSAPRNLFDSEFEERIFQMEPETLSEQLARTSKSDEIDLSLSCTDIMPGMKYETEVLTILTYAPNVQFITATVKKARLLPFNNKPFARVMLFEKRRLVEQKQTTVTPAAICSKCFITDCVPQKPSTSSSASTSSSPAGSSETFIIQATDAVFSESFLFHVTPQMLDRCHIVIEMFDTDPADSNRGPIPIGHCVIGPMCPGAGCAHWLQMIRKTGLPICMWHRLFKS